MIRKGLAVAVILLFVGTSIVPSISTAIEDKSCIATINDGNLSGYVNNTLMNPIQGARVRVYFHGTYEENYTDANGYYHVTNIPICWCMKNATASKEGYETEWILLSITENSTHDFILTSSDPKPEFEIVEIKGGIGLTVLIKNVGNADATNIAYQIDHGGGLFLRTTKWTGQVLDIPAGETGTLYTGGIRFGIGLGILTDIPWITVTISAPDADTIKRTVTAKTFGAVVILQ